MMKLFLLLALYSGTSQAAVTARFAGNTGMISILDYAAGGVRDDDPHRLFNSMNLPLRNEAGYGMGKTFRSADRMFTVSCNSGSQIHKYCSVVVRSAPWAQVNPQLGLIRFVAYGEDASTLSEVFFRESEGRFESKDGSFQIQSWGGFFVLQFKGAGR